MKKLYGLSILIVSASACQQQPAAQAGPGVVAGATVAPTPAHATRPAVGAAPEMAAPTASTNSLPGRRAPAIILQRYDLSALWQGEFDTEPALGPSPMDGFFGTDYRRIAFVFTVIRRDSLRPAVYHVQGKARFKKLISAFTGSITIKSLNYFEPNGLTSEEAGLLDVTDLSSVLTATATFEFREQPMLPTTGVFTGTGYLDFYFDDKGKANRAFSMMEASPKMPAKGAGLLYTGRWAGYQSGVSKPLLLSSNAFITAPAALSHFSIGDRDPSFNPKYAKLGWNDYWANDEWWTDSPKPSLTL